MHSQQGQLEPIIQSLKPKLHTILKLMFPKSGYEFQKIEKLIFK